MLDRAPVQELGCWAGLWSNGPESLSDVAQNLKTKTEFTKGGLLAIHEPMTGL